MQLFPSEAFPVWEPSTVEVWMNYKGELMYWETLMEDVNEQGLPPGFRFHPTDEELVTYYLASKVFNGGFYGVDIVEVDLNRCEPWELPDVTRMGERERYFFSLRDRKYPTGLRTNRATGAGYWKATGKDREVRAAATGALVGMKKTLVFYKGRAPRGEKTKWVLHEYRLDGELSSHHTYKEEWVICRIYNKASGDKKSTLYLDEPLSPSPPNGPNPSLQAPFLNLHYALQGPTLTLLQAHHPYYLHHDMNTVFPSSPPGPANQPTQEEEVPISIWLESYLQNPWISDTRLCSLGLPFEGGAVHDTIDMPMQVPAAGSSSIRIVDSLT